jgi:hypothetical protein
MDALSLGWPGCCCWSAAPSGPALLHRLCIWSRLLPTSARPGCGWPHSRWIKLVSVVRTWRIEGGLDDPFASTIKKLAAALGGAPVFRRRERPTVWRPEDLAVLRAEAGALFSGRHAGALRRRLQRRHAGTSLDRKPFTTLGNKSTMAWPLTQGEV